MKQGWDMLGDVLEAMPVGVLVWRESGPLSYSNGRAAEIVGRPLVPGVTAAEATAGWRMLRAGTREVCLPELLLPPRVFGGGVAAFRDVEFEHPDGERRAVEGTTVGLPVVNGAEPLAVTTFFDITEARHADALAAAEARVLAMVAADRPLDETLSTLASVFEAQADGMLASILLVEDQRTLRHAAAPSLPSAWTRQVDGEPVGPNRGSCGTAAHVKEPVIVTDIATDPRWVSYRDAALAFGLRACWSIPILSPDREVLGTFAFYYSEQRAPTQRLLDLAHRASRLATVVIRHRRQQQELRASEQHLSLVYDHVEDVLFQLRVEPQGYRFLSVNPAFSRTTGVPAEQVNGRLVEDVIPEPSRSLVLAKYAEAVRTKSTVRWEEMTPYPAGVRRGEVAITPVFDHAGQPQYLVGSVRDITEQHKELSERLQMATRGARIGIWCWHVRDGRVEWDEQMHRLYGRAAGEFSGNYQDFRSGVHPDDVSHFERALRAALSGEAALDTEFRVLWPDETIRYVKVNAVVQRDVDGKPLRVVGTNWDITAAKVGEEALRAAKEAAEAATHAKSLFLAHMSHEIRTPLHAILGYAQLLLKNRSLAEEQRRDVEVIRTSGNHLLTLINDILEISKIESGRTTLTVKPFDLPALLAELHSMFAALTAEKGISLSFELDPGLVRVVSGDAVKIRQVLINLLSNAVKFTDHGWIRTKVSSRELGEDRVAVGIAVEDTGSGIAESDLTRIFNPFDQSASGVHATGTGLGLAISSNFARLMDGELRVESVLGRGSTFAFSFQARRSAEAEGARVLSPGVDGELVHLDRAHAGRDDDGDVDRLSMLAGELPVELVDELRDAAVHARAARLASLAQRARAHSEIAALEIEKLVDGFRYDALLAALASGRER